MTSTKLDPAVSDDPDTEPLGDQASDMAVIQDYAYILGPAGNRKSVAEHDGTVRAWEHDDLYRLTRERITAANGALQSDERNRLSNTTVLGGAMVGYTWDANENLLSETGTEGTTTYRWDFNNRIAEVALEGGTTVQYVYDADGARLGRAVSAGDGSGEESRRIVDSSGRLATLVADLDASGALTAEYSVDPESNETLAYLGSQTLYLHADAIGSPREATPATGTSIGSADFDAFGNPGVGAALAGDLGFTGEYLDPDTGLHHLRARWLSTELGLFVSGDPLSRSAAGSQLIGHSYGYATSDPINWTDPTGLFPGKDLIQRRIVGNIVHKTIQSNFKEQHPGAFLDRWISTIARIPFNKCSGGWPISKRSCRSRPDIARRLAVSGQVYEIKPEKQWAAGLDQLEDYLLRHCSPKNCWISSALWSRSDRPKSRPRMVSGVWSREGCAATSSSANPGNRGAWSSQATPLIDPRHLAAWDHRKVHAESHGWPDSTCFSPLSAWKQRRCAGFSQSTYYFGCSLSNLGTESVSLEKW